MQGFLIGLLFGPLGILIALVSGDTTRMPCPTCKESIKKDALMCPHCKTPLRMSDDVLLPEPTRPCPTCQGPVTRHMTSCPHCGQRYSSRAAG